MIRRFFAHFHCQVQNFQCLYPVTDHYLSDDDKSNTHLFPFQSPFAYPARPLCPSNLQVSRHYYQELCHAAPGFSMVIITLRFKLRTIFYFAQFPTCPD